MSKTKAKKQKQIIAKQVYKQPIAIDFEITDEPLENPDYPPLPKDVQVDLEQSYTLMTEHPEQAIAKFTELKDRFPYYPKFNNYISAAYSQLEEYDKTRELVEETYRKFPEYLFARVNYAELCIQNNISDQVPIIFEGKTGLKELYPHRSVFHISEVSGFYGMMGLYYCFVNNKIEAERHYNLLKRVNPEHQFTKRIGKYLAAPAVLEALLRALQENR